MIKLELEVTTGQLVKIAAVLAEDGDTIPAPTLSDDSSSAKTPEQILAATAAEMAEKKTNVDGVTQQTASVAPDAGASTDAPAQDGNATHTALADSGDPAGSAFAANPEDCINNEGTLNAGETIAPPPPPPANVQLAKSTSTGKMIPWDERIHAASKKINAGDGTWRLKKGVDRDNLVPAVEAELERAQAGNGSAPSTSSVAPDAGDSTAQTVQNAVAQGSGQDTAGDAAPPANIPPPPPAAEATAPTTISTFPELLPLVTAAKAAGNLNDDRINAIIAEMGLTKFGELAVRTDKVAEFAAKAGLTNG